MWNAVEEPDTSKKDINLTKWNRETVSNSFVVNKDLVRLEEGGNMWWQINRDKTKYMCRTKKTNQKLTEKSNKYGILINKISREMYGNTMNENFPNTTWKSVSN